MDLVTTVREFIMLVTTQEGTECNRTKAFKLIEAMAQFTGVNLPDDYNED